MPHLFKTVHNNQKGFSLVEVIIAIAILALLSAPAIQAFFVSARLNQKSAQLDIATALASSKIEEFKASPQAYLTKEEKSKKYLSFLDENWQEISEENSASFFIQKEIINNNGLYSITITVLQQTPEGRETLLTLTGGKYLPPLGLNNSLSISWGV